MLSYSQQQEFQDMKGAIEILKAKTNYLEKEREEWYKNKYEMQLTISYLTRRNVELEKEVEEMKESERMEMVT